MSTRTLAWGVGGGLILTASLACSGSKINDVGNVGGDANAAGTPGAGGSNAGTSSTAGAGGPFPTAGVTGIGGYGGSEIGGYGNGGNHPGCFNDFNPNERGDDEAAQLALGPQNAVFLDTHYPTGDIKNYADQMVFPNSGVWEAYANFPAVSTALATDTTISLPAELSRAPQTLGQLYVTRQVACAGQSAAGHTLRVEVWWKLGGAIGHSPTEGMALGAVVKNKAVWFEDATNAFVSGEPDGSRPLNTLNRIVLQHTFADDDETDASKIVLGLWLLEEYALPTTFYIGNVKWD